MQNYYVDSQKLFTKAIESVYKKQVVAIDTEFTRQKTYYPILSLVQIAVGDEIFAVDCLADIELKPIYDIISDQKIKKIFHSCSQDLEIFHQKDKNIAQNVCDIQLMANFCGIGYNIGYSGIVEELIGVKLDKKMQNSDWQSRPLSKRQIEYAMLDVTYLEEIYQKLWTILLEKKREKWFLQDMESVVNEPSVENRDNLLRNFIRDKKGYAKSGKNLAKLRHLILWREKMAQEIDVPRRHFLSDEALEKMAIGNNFNVNLSEKNICEIKNIFAQIESGNNDVDLEEKIYIMSEAQKNQYVTAKNMVAKIADDEGLKEQFLVTSGVLKDVVAKKKRVDELVFGWRYDLIGGKLEELIS